MRGRGGWGEPEAPTRDLTPRAAFPHWPWAAPHPGCPPPSEREGDGGQGGVTTLARSWFHRAAQHGRGGPRPRPRSPQATGPVCRIAWVPMTGSDSRRSGQALECAPRGPQDCPFPPQPAGAPGVMPRLPQQPLSLGRDWRGACPVPAGRSEWTAPQGRQWDRPAPTQSQVWVPRKLLRLTEPCRPPILKPREPHRTPGLPVPPSTGCHHPMDRGGAGQAPTAEES